LLSLVFYLQMISEYIPRGENQIPLLTLFTLINFFIVFLSCVFTVFVLRFYYRPPSFLEPIEYQLPYYCRIILFKYIGKFLGLQFYCRRKNEIYSRNLNLNKESLFQKFDKQQIINDSTKSGNFRSFQKCNMLNVKNVFDKAKNKEFDDLLITLRMFNKCLQKRFKYKLNNLKLSKQEEYCIKLYFEEWKQASLVLDR